MMCVFCLPVRKKKVAAASLGEISSGAFFALRPPFTRKTHPHLHQEIDLDLTKNLFGFPLPLRGFITSTTLILGTSLETTSPLTMDINKLNGAMFTFCLAGHIYLLKTVLWAIVPQMMYVQQFCHPFLPSLSQ